MAATIPPSVTMPGSPIPIPPAARPMQHAQRLCCCGSPARLPHVCAKGNFHMHSKDKTCRTCPAWHTGSHSPSRSGAGRTKAERPHLVPVQVWGLPSWGEHNWSRLWQEGPSGLQPGSANPATATVTQKLPWTNHWGQLVTPKGGLECSSPSWRMASVWKPNTPCSHGLGELCSLITASLVRQGSQPQHPSSYHRPPLAQWLLLTAEERPQSSTSQDTNGAAGPMSPGPCCPTPSLQHPQGPVIIWALLCCNGFALEKLLQVIFPEARSLLKWKTNVATDFRSVSARAACKTALCSSTDGQKKAILAVCLAYAIVWSLAITLPALSLQDQHRNDAQAQKIKALNCLSKSIVSFFKSWIKLNGLSSILASSYVLPLDSEQPFYYFSSFFFLPKDSTHLLKTTRKPCTLREKKLAYLSFRVSVSVFVLVSQCKFKWIIFLYFFICHFFTHSL